LYDYDYKNEDKYIRNQLEIHTRRNNLVRAHQKSHGHHPENNAHHSKRHHGQARGLPRRGPTPTATAGRRAVPKKAPTKSKKPVKHSHDKVKHQTAERNNGKRKK
jgi:hypothetical protein